jgi:hypothetical protein
MTMTSLLIMTGLAFADTPVAPGYTVARTDAAHDALLAASPDAWARATRIVWGQAPYETEFRALWTARGLYVRFDAHDVEPWHTLTKRDDKIWNEEVVEIFLDPARTGRNYAELELNHVNVVCDLRMLQGFPDIKGEIEWNFAGIESRVTPMPAGGAAAAGDAASAGDSWIATAFLPWQDFASLPTPESVALPPKAGDRWRFNVFRIKRPHGAAAPEQDVMYAAWSKPPGHSFHVPDVFRDLIFQ